MKQTREHIEKRISKVRGTKRGPSPFRKTNKQFIEETIAIWKDRYLTDKIDYQGSSIKVEVGCRIHGYFMKYPNDLINSSGCPRCGNSFRKTESEFLAEVAQIFPDYNYSRSVYKNSHTKIEVLCKKHGLFLIKPNTLLSGSGCGDCGREKSLETKIKDGTIRHPNDIPEYEKYRNDVWRESERSFKQYFNNEVRNKDQHLDHIVSISEGWKNKVPPEIIGSKYNLRMLESKMNRKKSNKSDMSVDMLYNLYKGE